VGGRTVQTGEIKKKFEREKGAYHPHQDVRNGDCCIGGWDKTAVLTELAARKVKLEKNPRLTGEKGTKEVRE